jgi:hypothetical protein
MNSMKKNIWPAMMIAFALFAGTVTASYGQKKVDEAQISDYSGPIIRKKDPSQGAKLGNLFNMKMHQSLSASIGSWGGNMMNTVAFTNSMNFFFTPKLTGQFNVSLLTSPFSQVNFYGSPGTNKLQVALDARLNYQVSKNMDIHLELRRGPGRYGMYPGSFYGRYYGSPYQYGPAFER